MIKESRIIPAYNQNHLQKSIAKLNRKARKLGCAPLVLSFTPAENFETYVNPYTGLRMFTPIIIEQVEAHLEYEIPTLNGYELIAKLDIYPSDDGGSEVLVSAVPEKEVPVEYKNMTEINCDHCGYNRIRNHSILIRHMDTNEYLQVGSTCVKDFFAGNDPADFMFYASIKFDTIIGGIKEESSFGSYGREYSGYDIESVLTVTAAAIEKWGWMSRSKAYHEECMSTSDHVFHNLNPRPNMHEEEKCQVNENNKALAEKALEWWENVDPKNNDYLLNCVKLTKLAYIPYKFMGFACSMVSTYQREMEKVNRIEREKAVKAGKRQSAWVGNIGNRILGIPVTVISTRKFDTNFGTSTLYVFKDTLENIYKTFYTGSSWEYTEGNKIIIDGTVKKHEEFRGEKQTMLNRVSAKEAPSEAFEENEFTIS